MNVKSVNLADSDWRDANLDTLHEWHPEYRHFNCDRQRLLRAFRELLTRYREHLVASCPDEPLEDLQTHVEIEVIMHFAQSLQKVNEEVWRERNHPKVASSTQLALQEVS